MANVKYADKLAKLGEHCDVKRGTLPLQDWAAAIKERLGRKDDAIDVLFETYTKGNLKVPADKPATSKPADVVVKPVAGVVASKDMLATAHTNRVEVTPQISVYLPATTINHAGLRVSDSRATLWQIMAWLQTYSFGVLTGGAIVAIALRKIGG